MEVRGDRTTDRLSKRPSIARRSCDQCRSRKIGCDRASPCSNCVAVKLQCSYSTIASNPTLPRQRVLISAKYEQKIDDIAHSIDGIKWLLQEHGVQRKANESERSSGDGGNKNKSRDVSSGRTSVTMVDAEASWNTSFHILKFVKTVVEDQSRSDVQPQAAEVLSSLRHLLQILEKPVTARHLALEVTQAPINKKALSMPPLDAALKVIRWANSHQGYHRISLMSRVLPLDKFAEICQKVYFPVNECSQIDVIIANGYLASIFFEHAVSTGSQDDREHCQLCRTNLDRSLSQLPLLLLPSLEAVAGLTLAAFHGIETSRATMAWMCISTAANFCQTLGYHRRDLHGGPGLVAPAAHENLFWTVYKLDKGLSIHLGRASTIRDAEITLPFDDNMPQFIKVGRIQGQVYDRLYSPESLTKSPDERRHLVKMLSLELRGFTATLRQELSVIADGADHDLDPMRPIYVLCDLVCVTSLLALVLRAIPESDVFFINASDDCVAVAREALDAHQQCMTSLRACKSAPMMLSTYINWAILHVPFVPFSILFTYTVQNLDMTDLSRLDGFAASLKPDADTPGSATHPHRLYELLCQAARIYLSRSLSPAATSTMFAQEVEDTLGEYGLKPSALDSEFSTFAATTAMDFQTRELNDWFQNNQEIVSLLDEGLL